jgi:uncharacterized phage-associated protein
MIHTYLSTSTKVADFFVEKVYLDTLKGEPFSASKVQSLLYYSYVWMLVLQNKHLFPEKIKGYDFGILVTDEGDRLKNIESGVDISIATDIRLLPDYLKNFLEMIWRSYRGFLGTYLINNLICNELPYQMAFSTPTKFILDGSIEDYYTIKKAASALKLF